MVNEKLLKFRNHVKKKMPKFLRDGATHKVEVSNNWRKPKGRHSKMRHHIKGHRKSPKVGYGSPREIKGMTRLGFNNVIISSLTDLNKIKLNPKTDVVTISSKVGNKNKILIVKKLLELKVTIFNLKNPEKFEALVLDKLKSKKDAKVKKTAKIEKKSAKKSSKTVEEVLTDEDKKKKEKDEKDKVLIQK